MYAGSAKSRLLERLCTDVEVPLAAKVLSRDADMMQLVSCLEGWCSHQLKWSLHFGQLLSMALMLKHNH